MDIKNYKTLYKKYKNKNIFLLKQIGGYGDNAIFSVGFELQSSDFFIVFIRYFPFSGKFTGIYPTGDQIPENEPFPLFTSEIGTTYSVQLDAIGMEDVDAIREYITTLDKFTIPKVNLQLKDLELMESKIPMDTEFVITNINTESILQFEEDKMNPKYTELLVKNFNFEKDKLFNFIKTHYIRNTYETHDDEDDEDYNEQHVKLNIFYYPYDLENVDVPRIGFYHAGFKLGGIDLIKEITIVPQATFNCNLKFAFYILLDLIKNTPPCKHIPEILETIDEIKIVYNDIYETNIQTELISFIFLIKYYKKIMATKSKQELGIAVRHKFSDIYGSLSITDKGKITDFGITEAIILEESVRQEIDGIHKYPYADKKILIEYRLFSYILSGDKDNNYITYKFDY